MVEKRRVVVLDDYVPMLEILRDVLDLQGYEVWGFRRSDVDVDGLVELRPHVIVLDPIPTPDSPVPSFALLQDIRADSRLDEVPVLLCGVTEPIAERSVELSKMGKIRFLRKPFDSPMLSAVLSALAYGQEPPDSELPEA